MVFLSPYRFSFKSLLYIPCLVLSFCLLLINHFFPLVLHLANLRSMPKYRILHIVITGCFLLLLFRFYYFQVHEYSKYETKAGHNSLRKISLHAPRGIIYDRHGIPLVDNRQIYDLSVIPFDVTDQFNYSLLASLTGWSSTKLKKDIAARKQSFNRFRPYTLERHLDFDTRSHLEENKLDLPGTIFSEFPARSYPNNARLTHVLGYLRVVTDEFALQSNNDLDYKSGDIFGFSGIEKMYESLLRGKDGTAFHLVDIYGINHGIYADSPGTLPVTGDDLYLTINSKLQNKIED